MSGGNEDHDSNNQRPLQHENIRMVLIEDDPGIVFKRSLKAGAKEIFPIGKEHGWRLGRD